MRRSYGSNTRIGISISGSEESQRERRAVEGHLAGSCVCVPTPFRRPLLSGSDGKAAASLFLLVFLSITPSYSLFTNFPSRHRSHSLRTARALTAAGLSLLIVFYLTIQLHTVMATKKGLEDFSKVELTTSSAAYSSSSASSPQLAAFWKLPFELQYTIILAACGPPVLHRWTVVGRTTDCTSTMLALQRTSRMFYVMVTPLLYKYVRLV